MVKVPSRGKKKDSNIYKVWQIIALGGSTAYKVCAWVRIKQQKYFFNFGAERKGFA